MRFTPGSRYLFHVVPFDGSTDDDPTITGTFINEIVDGNVFVFSFQHASSKGAGRLIRHNNFKVILDRVTSTAFIANQANGAISTITGDAFIVIEGPNHRELNQRSNANRIEEGGRRRKRRSRRARSLKA